MKFLKDREETKLEKEISYCHEQLRQWAPNTEEYAAVSGVLDTLYRALEKESRNNQVSADTKLIVAANLGGTLLLVVLEQTGIIPRALGNLIKPKV